RAGRSDTCRPSQRLDRRQQQPGRRQQRYLGVRSRARPHRRSSANQSVTIDAVAATAPPPGFPVPRSLIPVPPVLSRVADCVFWMSRYLERAENTARFIEVNQNLTLDADTGGGPQWLPLVDTAGDRDLFEEL